MKLLASLAAFVISTSFFTPLNGQSYYKPITEVLKSNQLLPGSYALAKDFFYNFPSTRDSIRMNFEPRDTEPWLGTFKVIPRFASTGKRVKRCWGFSSGQQAFIFHQIEFFPIEIDDEGNLFFYGFDIIDYSGTNTAAFFGGAMGAGIHTVIVEAEAKKHKVKYIINSNTGEPIHPVYGNLNDPAPVLRDMVVYRPHKKETESGVRFLLDEKFVYSFVPGSYLIKQYGPLEKEIKICVGENFDHCTIVDLPGNETIWFRLSFPDTGKEPILEQVEDVDIFEYNKAVNKQDKRRKQEPVEVLD